MNSRPRWYWLEGAIAGFLVFPAVWLFIGWLWLNVIPHGPVILGFASATEATALAAPLPSLFCGGLLLGAASGMARQLWPRFGARLLAMLAGLVGVAWTGHELKWVVDSWKFLISAPDSIGFGSNWFTLFPYLTPFCYSLGLFLFALLSRHRSSSRTKS